MLDRGFTCISHLGIYLESLRGSYNSFKSVRASCFVGPRAREGMLCFIFDKYSCQGWCMRQQPPHVRRSTTGGTPTVPESWLKVTLWLNVTRATL